MSTHHADSAHVRDLRSRREAVVREHMASENESRFDDTLATFTHPRYELIGTGQVYDGTDEVKEYYARSRAVFPDQRNEVRSILSAHDTVVVEFDLLGTHLGSLTGRGADGKVLPVPDGGPVRVRARRRRHRVRARLLRLRDHLRPAARLS